VRAQREAHPRRIDGLMQCSQRTEQLHAALDFQQQGIGRLDADQWRELLCAQGKALQHGCRPLRFRQFREYDGIP